MPVPAHHVSGFFMAKKKEQTYKKDEEAKTFIDSYDKNRSEIQTIRDTWEEKEQMLLCDSGDSISSSTKSKVNDARLATIIWERAARVMAQPPTGKIQALSMRDTGKNVFMNTLLYKYVIPNANVQGDIRTKLKLWDVYSNVYGSFGVLTDYFINKEIGRASCRERV